MPTAIPATAKAGLITCEFTPAEPDGAGTVLIDSFQGNVLQSIDEVYDKREETGSISSAISARCVRLEPQWARAIRGFQRW
jgi:hypothetical protein